MKMFQAGDKVRFLNQKGEGVIRRFLGKTMVSVEIEDGFEIPVPVNELVLAESPGKKAAEIAPVKPPAPIEGVPGVFLALVPDSVFASSIEVVLINNTEFSSLYSFTIREADHFNGISSGILDPASNKTLYSTVKNETEHWQDLYVQIIFHREGEFNPLPAVDKAFPVRSAHFSRIQLLKKAPQIEKNAFLYTIADVNEIRPFSREMVEQTFTGSVAKDRLFRLNESEDRDRPKHIRVNPKSGYMEVDLHIEELLDDYSGLSNAEIVNIQLGHCRKAIEKALRAGAGKITIIHGVGNGTLRKEVRNLLQEYGSFRFYDAPYEKFGAGATEVLLK
jgi:hypothetical protein